MRNTARKGQQKVTNIPVNLITKFDNALWSDALLGASNSHAHYFDDYAAIRQSRFKPTQRTLERYPLLSVDSRNKHCFFGINNGANDGHAYMTRDAPTLFIREQENEKEIFNVKTFISQTYSEAESISGNKLMDYAFLLRFYLPGEAINIVIIDLYEKEHPKYDALPEHEKITGKINNKSNNKIYVREYPSGIKPSDETFSKIILDDIIKKGYNVDLKTCLVVRIVDSNNRVDLDTSLKLINLLKPYAVSCLFDTPWITEEETQPNIQFLDGERMKIPGSKPNETKVMLWATGNIFKPEGDFNLIEYDSKLHETLLRQWNYRERFYINLIPGHIKEEGTDYCESCTLLRMYAKTIH